MPPAANATPVWGPRHLRTLGLRTCSRAARGNFVPPWRTGPSSLTPCPIARYNPATMASDSNVYFDQRTYRRHIKSGRLTEAEYKSHLEALPDASENIMDPQEGGDDDGYDVRAVPKEKPVAVAVAVGAAPTPEAFDADPFSAAPMGAPVPAPSAPIAAPLIPPSINDAPAPPPPPLEVPIGAAPIIPPKVD